MLRTLLYVTTHLSEWHTSGLRCLWPAAARRARLLRDAVVFNSGRPATAAQLAAVAAAFPRYNNRSVEIFSAEATRQVHRKAFTLGSTKKQMGAILALSEAEARGWFDGYDWVVRLNPDVIVSEDRFLRTHMARDGIDAVLAFCGRSSPSGTSTSRVHTDFMAWRPATLPRGQFALPPNATTVCAQPGVMECNAERHATRALAPIVASHHDAPGVTQRVWPHDNWGKCLATALRPAPLARALGLDRSKNVSLRVDGRGFHSK